MQTTLVTCAHHASGGAYHLEDQTLSCTFQLISDACNHVAFNTEGTQRVVREGAEMPRTRQRGMCKNKCIQGKQ